MDQLSPLKHNRVLVVTVHTNDSEFLELQHLLLSKHMQVPYDFAVGFDEPEMQIHKLDRSGTRESVESFVRKNNLTYIQIPKAAHHQRNDYFYKSDHARRYSPLDPALRCSDSVQYMLSVLPWQKYQAILLLDADMFPIRPITNIPVSTHVPFHAVYQVRSKGKRVVEYIWNGIFWISGDAPFPHLINFDLVKNRGLRTDVGGQTAQWIKRIAGISRPGTYMSTLTSGKWGSKNAESIDLDSSLIDWLNADYRNEQPDQYFSEMYDGTFFHYRAGSNWQRRDPGIDVQNRKALKRILIGPQS